tara:strand:+ start:254 stop:499 length:246 start_codon:yes stop_codon:yes gene_type:complete
MIRIYIIGLSILTTALVINFISNQISITNWYNFINSIIEKESVLKALKEEKIISIIWMFFIYPFFLGLGYLIGEKIYNYLL